MNLDSNQIIGGLIGLGLVAKGIAEWVIKARGKAANADPARGCLYGDAAHDELKRMIGAECKAINDKIIEILAILRERK